MWDVFLITTALWDHSHILWAISGSQNRTILAIDLIEALSDSIEDYRMKHEISRNYKFNTDTFTPENILFDLTLTFLVLGFLLSLQLSLP